MRKTIFMLLMIGAVVATSVSCKKDDYASKDELKALQDKVDKGVDKNGIRMKTFTGYFGPGYQSHYESLFDMGFNKKRDVVLVYTMSSGDVNLSPLPISFGDDIFLLYEVDKTATGINIKVWDSYYDKYPNITSVESIFFTVVVIPTSAIQANPGVDLNDYEAVQKAFLDNESVL